MRILHLTLKKKWFDMIEADIKKEEYRELKEYWEKRLGCYHDTDRETGYGFTGFKEFDAVQFRHGYARDARKILVELDCIRIETGNEEWGAIPGKKYFVIKLGNKIRL